MRVSYWDWPRSRPARPPRHARILTPLFVDQATPQSISERAQIVMAEIAAGEIAKKSPATRRRPQPTTTPAATTRRANAPPAKKD